MRRSASRFAIAAAAVALAIGAAFAALAPELGAGGLLHPARRRVTRPAPAACDEEMFAGAGIRLAGWRCRAGGERRGTLVCLHGIADNRASAAGLVDRFGRRGLDVIAYDSRAHGESDGDMCTYGFFEKEDLRRVWDTVQPGPVVLLGASAVALQEAADDRRVTTVVAAETFSDLRTVATERAPFFFTRAIINRAFRVAEERGHFRVDEVSPRTAAARLTIPVLLIHGAEDRETPPNHAERVFAALNGPKRLILVPGAAHNASLRPEVWMDIEQWIDRTLKRPDER